MAPLDGTLVFELAFGNTWGDASPTWTDVSSYLQSGFVRTASRQYELDRFEAGVGIVTLKNTDRRFEPAYASGAYAPDVIPWVPGRLRISYGGTPKTVWRGFVERWELLYPEESGSVGWVRAHLTDAFKLFNRAQGLHYDTEVLADDPLGYWKLEETSGTTATDDGSAGIDGTYTNTGSITLAQGGPLTGDSKAPDFDDDGPGYVNVGDLTGSVLEADWTAEAWLFPADDDGGEFIRLKKSGNDLFALGVGISPNYEDLIVWVPGSSGGSSGWYNGASDPGDAKVTQNAWNHVLCVYDYSEKTFTWWVNGARVWDLYPTSFDQSVLTGVMNILIGTNDGTDSDDSWDGRIGRVAIYPKRLSPGRIQAHYAAFLGAFAAESADTRIGNILDGMGWPSADRDLEAGVLSLTAITDPSGSVLSLLQSAAASEGGSVFMDYDGKVRFWNQRTRYLETTSQATFQDDGTDFTGVAPAMDDDLIYTRVEATPLDGQREAAADLTAEASYGQRALDLGTVDVSQDDAAGLAYAALARYKEPALRVASIEFEPQVGAATLWPLARDLEVGQRITYQHTPPGGGTQIDTDLHIEGITYVWTPDTFKTMMQCSPADTQAAWILGSTVNGVLGTTTRAG